MKSSGFTLIELLVTIAVMSIMATIAVPGFQGMMASNRLASDYNEILSGLNYARSEAIKRREPVTFEVVDDAPWQYVVSYSGGELARREGRGAQVTVDEIEVVFNAMGRRASCPSGCSLTIVHSSGGDRDIQVSATGRIGKPTS